MLSPFFLVEIYTPNPNRKGSDYNTMVEATGIEPVSKSISERVSPSAVVLFRFPSPNAEQQAFWLR